MKAKLLLLIMLMFSPLSRSQAFHIFVGASPNYADLFSVIRFGGETWEGGKLRMDMYGINKIFKTGGVTYMTLGLGLVAPSDIGFFAGAGFDKKMFGGLSVRGELNAAASSGAYLSGIATLGVSWRF